MLIRRKKNWGNFRFRFRSQPEDPRKEDPVRSVLPSSKELRRRRWRLWLTIAKWAAASTAAIILLCFGYRVWRESTSVNPAFTVGEFNFGSTIPEDRGGLTYQAVQDVTGLRGDTHVMDVDLQTVRQALLALPQVQTATVTRQFPNHIDITVVERRPVAWLCCPEKGLLPRNSEKGRLIDAKGNVFACRTLLTAYTHLPEIQVPPLSWVTDDCREASDRRIRCALDILAAVDQQIWPNPITIRSLTISGDYAIRAVLSDQAEITFGLEKITRQARRLAAMYEWADKHGKSIESAVLIAQNNVPVTFFPSPPPQEATNTHSSPAASAEVIPAAAVPTLSTLSPAAPARSGAPTAATKSASREDRDIQAILRGN